MSEKLKSGIKISIGMIGYAVLELLINTCKVLF